MKVPVRAITTDRLVLEPTVEKHASRIHDAVVASMAELRPWMSWAVGATRAGADEAAVGAEIAWHAGTSYNFTIFEAGRVAGHISIRVRLSEGNIGYWIRSDRAGHGIATEAGRAVLAFGFETLGLQRIELRAGVANRGSCRVAEKLGMRREGLLRVACEGEAGPYDAYLYSTLVDEWRATGAVDGAGRGRADAATGQAPAVIGAPDFSRGLVAAVMVDDRDGAVLMLAHMNAESYARTVSTGRLWLWSRSREELWEKGATSGNFMEVVSLAVDCDRDALLVRVRPNGPACHTGARTCFDGGAETTPS